MKRWLVLLATLALVLAPVSQAATVNSNVATISLSLTIPESISVVPTVQSVTLTSSDGGHTFGSSNAAITTTWHLSTGHSSLQVWAYFSGSNALDGGSNGSIPASAFFVGTGTVSSGACTNAGPFSANSCPELENITSPATTGSKTDNFNFGTSDVTTLSLGAGTFVGTLNVQAVAL